MAVPELRMYFWAVAKSLQPISACSGTGATPLYAWWLAAVARRQWGYTRPERPASSAATCTRRLMIDRERGGGVVAVGEPFETEFDAQREIERQ